ncbi:hypothetical protein ES708_18968 [subsurface metagenome]
MKKMIKFSGIMAVLIWVTAFTASAQPGYGKGHHGRHGHWVSDSCRVQLMVDDLSKELSLTDEQKQKIEEIHYAHINEVKLGYLIAKRKYDQRTVNIYQRIPP